MPRGSVNDLLSGRRRGVVPALMRTGLAALTPLYRGAVFGRNLAFDRGWRTIERAAAPVVSVGNLTTGGTGKTPVVSWIVHTLQAMGARPGILSRGYRSLDGSENDEKRLLDALCPGVPHLQNPDRVAAAGRAIAEHGCDVLVLDDGFQHRRLARDLDIVLIDALNPWGYGSLLPRGLLREPVASLRRADAVCMTRVNQCSVAQRESIRAIVAAQTRAPIAELAFVPSRLISGAGESAPLASLHGCRVGACCGVGNPESFFRSLVDLGVELPETRRRTFPDHHQFTAADLASLESWVERSGIEAVVVTRKDLVKLPPGKIGPARLLALDIGLQWESARDELESRLRGLLGGR